MIGRSTAMHKRDAADPIQDGEIMRWTKSSVTVSNALGAAGELDEGEEGEAFLLRFW